MIIDMSSRCRLSKPACRTPQISQYEEQRLSVVQGHRGVNTSTHKCQVREQRARHLPTILSIFFSATLSPILAHSKKKYFESSSYNVFRERSTDSRAQFQRLDLFQDYLLHARYCISHISRKRILKVSPKHNGRGRSGSGMKVVHRVQVPFSFPNKSRSHLLFGGHRSSYCITEHIIHSTKPSSEKCYKVDGCSEDAGGL